MLFNLDHQSVHTNQNLKHLLLLFSSILFFIFFDSTTTAMNPPTTLAEFAKQLMPTGMKFCPTDQELIVNYLFQKINGGLTDFQKEIVKDCDLYGEEEPWQIWLKYKAATVVDMEQNLYFFTRLKTKNNGGKRILRRVGKSDGTWHGEDAGSKINCSVVADGREVFLIGYKKRFNYRNPKSDQHALWIMHEYSLTFTDYVICRLKYSKPTTVPTSLRLSPPPAAMSLPETRPWISLGCGDGNVISGPGETNNQGKCDAEKNESRQIVEFIEKAKKTDAEMINQKIELAVSAEAKNDESKGHGDGEMAKKGDLVETKNDESKGHGDGEMAKKGDVVETKNDESKGNGEGRCCFCSCKKGDLVEMNNEKTENFASAPAKTGLENEQISDFEKNGQAKAKKSIDGEMNSQKKEDVVSVPAKTGLENEQISDFEKNGQAKAKKSIDGEMTSQKKEVVVSVPADTGFESQGSSSDPGKNSPMMSKSIDREMTSQKKGVAASALAKNGREIGWGMWGSSDCFKNDKGKGKKDDDKAKSDRKMSDGKKKEKATSVNELMDRLYKKDELVTKPLPKIGRGRTKRPRVEHECTGEDGSTSGDAKRSRGNMDLLIEVLGLNK